MDESQTMSSEVEIATEPADRASESGGETPELSSSDGPHPARRPERRKSGFALPSLLLAGGIGALSVARNLFERSQLFVPDRFPNGVWDPSPFGLPAEDVWFRSDDDQELHGWWVPHRKAKGTVLYCHGNSGSIAHQIGDLRLLRRLGVNVLAFDYRGYGRSSGKPSEKGLYLDVRAAYRHLTVELAQPADEVLLFGHSLGGAVAIDAALDCAVAGVITQSTFTDVRDAARGVFPGLPLHLAARRQFASIDKIGQIEVPNLVIHGSEDGMFPLALAERLHEAASNPKEIYVVAGAGHNDVHRQGGMQYLRRLSKFRKLCVG